MAATDTFKALIDVFSKALEGVETRYTVASEGRIAAEKKAAEFELKYKEAEARAGSLAGENAAAEEAAKIEIQKLIDRVNRIGV